MCKMPFYGKIIQEGHLQSAKFRNKGKFRMPKEKKKKTKLGSSFLRQISQPSFQISQAALPQAALPQASVVAAGRLSVAADPVA